MFTVTAGCGLIVDAACFHNFPGLDGIIWGTELPLKHVLFALQTVTGKGSSRNQLSCIGFGDVFKSL